MFCREMYLFLSCLVAYCLKGVDLWDPTRFDAGERAADTAKLIDLVNNADSFKVLYISRSEDSDEKEDEDGKNVLGSMKLLHKTFDTYRKSNDFIDGANIQYISNPEVLQDYKNPKVLKERSEIQDIINGAVTTERSSIEEPDRRNIKSSHPMKSFMKHFRRRQEMNLDTSSFDDNDAGEQIASAVPVPWDSKETKRFILKSMHNSNQVKPIIESVLNTYTVKVNLQKGGKPNTNNNLKKNKKLLPEESRKKKSHSKNEHISIKYSKENHSSEDKEDVLVNLKKRFKIASTMENINTLKPSKYKQESRLKENRFKEQVRKEENDSVSIDRNSKARTRQKTHKIDDTEIKDENKRNFVSNKSENKVSVNKQATDWENDEKNEREPESHDSKFQREINQKKKDNVRERPYKGKNQNVGENNDSDEKSKIRRKQKSNIWNKQNDMDKKFKNADYDTTSSNRNKKVDSWNKRDDTERLKGWDRKDDNWNKKDDSRSRERTQNKKDYDNRENKREDDDNFKSGGEFKKYISSDNIGADRTENSGWGNYALFKKLRDKKNNMEGNNIEKEKRIPNLQKRAPKPSSYEDYAPQRDDYYHQPKKSLRTFNRTPMPMSGKRPIFD